MVSQPARGTDRRLTASATTNRTVQSGVTLKRITDNMAIMCCRWPSSSRGAAPDRAYRTCLLQTGVIVPRANLPHRLESQAHAGGNLGNGPAFMHVAEGQCAENGANWLDAAAEHVIRLIAVRLLQTHAKTSIRPHAQV